MPVEEEIILTKGSKYRIESVETKDKPLVSRGIFRGYTAIGPDDWICIEFDDSHKEMAGRLRIIPCHMIIAIDVVEAAKEEEKCKEPEAMYG